MSINGNGAVHRKNTYEETFKRLDAETAWRSHMKVVASKVGAIVLAIIIIACIVYGALHHSKII